MQNNTTHSLVNPEIIRLTPMKIWTENIVKTLSHEEFKTLFDRGFRGARDRALFGIVFYCNCPVFVALNVTADDLQNDKLVLKNMRDKPYRTVVLHPDLQQLLEDHKKTCTVENLLFPDLAWLAQNPGKSLQVADTMLKQAGERANLSWISLASFHRTALRRNHSYRLI